MQDMIIGKIRELLEETDIDLDARTQLIGGDSAIDSMGLVSLCLFLEEIGEDQGFEFDWTSETAMSKSRSMFRSIGSLAEEFSRQKSLQ